MRNKNVLHIAFKHSNEDTRIFQKECSSLAQHGYNVILVTSDIRSAYNDDEKNGVRRVVLKSSPRRVLRVFLYNHKLKKYIKQLSDIDLVHIHEPSLLLIALWLKKRGLHVIFDSHEDYLKQLKTSKGTFFAKLYKLYEKHVCSRIDAVIFPCQMVDREVFDYPVQKMVYIDNYPILRTPLKSPKEKNEFIACYTGTLSRDRGVYNSVIAWNRAKIRGILAGAYSTPDEKERTELLPEYQCVEYAGILPHDRVTEVYDRATIGMAVLRDVGQYHKGCNIPTKVGEYMMNGLPTIIYRTPYIEKIMKEYEFGIMVDPDDCDEIAEAICFLKDNPDAVKRMIENGFRAVRDVFNWETQEEKLLELYSDILS